MADKASKDKEFSWGDLNGTVANRLRKPKVADVPAPIVRQAQRSYDGVKIEGSDEMAHILEREFASEEMAAAFAKHMRNAGNHTKPTTSVSVAVDPEEDGNKRLVRWKAGTRRGRAATAGD